MTSNEELRQWVEQVNDLTQADNIHWCDGSKEEYQQLIEACT